MTRNAAYLLRNCLALVLAFSLGVPAVASADETDDAGGAGDATEDLQLTAYELQQQIEERTEAYAAARDEVDAATNAIEENRERIEELEREIPEQQERSARAAREMYKFQQQGMGIIDFLLSAGNFYDFLAQLEYVNRVVDANADEMARLSQLKAEIAAAQDELRESQREASARAEDARAAMAAAQEAQAEVQRRIEEEARQQAEIAAMAAALAEEERKNDEAASPDDAEAEADAADSGAAAPVAASGAASDAASDAPAAVATPDMSADETSFVAEWQPRIDAYLAGSPLAGQGTTFARAAYKYGVDPRFSPAISFTESSKGLYCFKPYNAWGWGSSSWSSWEEAIDAHVGGLARGYGGQISEAAAKKYCPPNWQTWYNRTLAQMNLI